jgi:hypothetical protein
VMIGTSSIVSSGFRPTLCWSLRPVIIPMGLCCCTIPIPLPLPLPRPLRLPFSLPVTLMNLCTCIIPIPAITLGILLPLPIPVIFLPESLMAPVPILLLRVPPLAQPGNQAGGGAKADEFKRWEDSRRVALPKRNARVRKGNV